MSVDNDDVGKEFDKEYDPADKTPLVLCTMVPFGSVASLQPPAIFTAGVQTGWV